MSKILLYFSIVYFSVSTWLSYADVTPVATHLKPRLPEWRPHIVEYFPSGVAKTIVFYEDEEGKEAQPVKRLQCHENGKVAEEIGRAHV